MCIAWIMILWGSAVSMFVIGAFFLEFDDINTRTRLCFFMSWYTHSTPRRLVLHPRHLVPGTMRVDLYAPPYTEPLIHQCLGFMLSVSVFVVCVTFTNLPLPLLTLFLLVCSVLKHAHRAMVWRYTSTASLVVDYIARTWVTILTYATSITFFYITQKNQWTSDGRAWKVLVGGLAWPLVRHGVRYTISLLLVDPHGTRGEVRVYTSLTLDLPVLISINAQDDIDVVWAMMVCLSIVDAGAFLMLRWLHVEGMFAVSNLLWMNFISLSFLITLKSPDGLTVFQVTQRVWYAVIYLCLVMVLPGAYVRMGKFVAQQHRVKILEELYHLNAEYRDEAVQHEDDADSTKGCCPVMHSRFSDVQRDKNQDFSDESVSTSGHVMGLTRVVKQADAVSFALWGIYQLYLEKH